MIYVEDRLYYFRLSCSCWSFNVLKSSQQEKFLFPKVVVKFNLDLSWTVLNVFEYTAKNWLTEAHEPDVNPRHQESWLTPHRSRRSPGDDASEHSVWKQRKCVCMCLGERRCIHGERVWDERDALWPQAPIKNRLRLLWRYRWTEVFYEILLTDGQSDWFTPPAENKLFCGCFMCPGVNV